MKKDLFESIPTKSKEGILEFPCSVQRLNNGNTLIADGGDELGHGSEILEINKDGEIIWRFGEGLYFAHSAERLSDGGTLITDTGNSRLLIVESEGSIRLDSNNWGSLSDGTQISWPNDAHQLKDGTLLVTDRNRDRILIVDLYGRLQWDLQTPQIRHPHNADKLSNGNIIVAASGRNRVLELDLSGKEVWGYGNIEAEKLNFPRDADRTKSNRVLITDSRHPRIIEVSTLGSIEWEFIVDYYTSFYEADLLLNNNVLISDLYHHQVIEVDRSGKIVWSFCNYESPVPTVSYMLNRSFSALGTDRIPEDWYFYRRFAQGAGDYVLSDENDPGLNNRGSGSLFLSQRIAVQPQKHYIFSGDLLTTKMMRGCNAYLQLYFLDSEGRPLTSLSAAPHSYPIYTTSSWLNYQVNSQAPDRAASVEARVFIGGGDGCVYIRDPNMQEIH